MALYAVDDDDLLFAGHAEPGKIYWCMDCFGPVKRRRGRNKFPHFYHVKPALNCRLYSKTEDHLLAQLQIQKMFPPGVLQIERPFLKLSRIADLCWEDEKIIFEVQCSPISEQEVEGRMSDYRGHGYEVIWLLDDRRYNKRRARPAEEFLRKTSTYYLSLRKGLACECYDQFEVFSLGQRVKKGKRMPIDLRKIGRKPRINFDEKLFPKQIVALQSSRYFFGDRTDRALRKHMLTLQNWRALEIHLTQTVRKPPRFIRWIWRHILNPYLNWIRRFC